MLVEIILEKRTKLAEIRNSWSRRVNIFRPVSLSERQSVSLASIPSASILRILVSFNPCGCRKVEMR